MGFNGKTVWRFQTNKQQKTFIASSKQPHESHGPLMQQLIMDLLTRKKELQKKWKSIQVKTVGTLQDKI